MGKTRSLQGFRRLAGLLCVLGALVTGLTCVASLATSGATASAAIRIRPSISSLTIRPSTFVAAASGPSTLAVKARATGAIVRYAAFNASTILFTVQRPLPGRRAGHRCVKPTSRNRRARRCTRYLRVGGFTYTNRLALGFGRFRFTGRVSGRKLKPGPYKMQAVPRSAAGLVGAPGFGQFNVKR